MASIAGVGSKMKVFVCLIDGDGCYKVYESEENAQMWEKANGPHAFYTEMLIEWPIMTNIAQNASFTEFISYINVLYVEPNYNSMEKLECSGMI